MQKSIARPQRIIAKIVLLFCLAYLLALSAVAAVLWTLADRWWPATILSYFPLWILVMPLFLLAPAALRWQRRSLFMLLAAAVVLVWPIMGLQIGLHATPDDGHTPFIRVMTCNMHRHQLSVPEFRTVLENVRPDVVALQDWLSADRDKLFPPDTWNTRCDGELFLASRYPIIEAESIPLVEPPPVKFLTRPGAAAYYRLLTPLGEVNLINLHLSSPHAALNEVRAFDPTLPEQITYNSRSRGMESASIEQFADQLTGPVLIMGDFNTPMQSVLYRRYWDRFTNAFSAAGFGFGTTHFSTTSSLRIDHILFGSGWRARACWVGPEVGSPHRPVVADLQRESDSSFVDSNADSPR
jgi:vancomycin resistance protein VanJ